MSESTEGNENKLDKAIVTVESLSDEILGNNPGLKRKAMIYAIKKAQEKPVQKGDKVAAVTDRRATFSYGLDGKGNMLTAHNEDGEYQENSFPAEEVYRIEDAMVAYQSYLKQEAEIGQVNNMAQNFDEGSDIWN